MLVRPFACRRRSLWPSSCGSLALGSRMTLLRRVHCCLLTAALLAGAAPAPAHAAPDKAAPSVSNVLDDAEKAWRIGAHGRVRELLEPLAESLPEDPIERQQLLVLLADATVSDPSLDPAERRDRAARHLERLMEADPTWRMPKAIYAPDLYDLYLEVREDRAIRAGEQCRADLNACRADLATSESERRRLEREKQTLTRQLQSAREEQIVRDRVKRVRALAAIPFGFGHFYNDNRALGATFLSAELAFGAAGLGLLINRTILCRRTAGFQKGSLECADRPGLTQDRIVSLRKAEEVMGWFFLGTIAIDIIVAQVLFRPFETVSVRRAKDVDLEEGTRPKRRPRQSRRAKVRPSSAIVPGGAAAGITVRF